MCCFFKVDENSKKSRTASAKTNRGTSAINIPTQNVKTKNSFQIESLENNNDKADIGDDGFEEF